MAERTPINFTAHKERLLMEHRLSVPFQLAQKLVNTEPPFTFKSVGGLILNGPLENMTEGMVLFEQGDHTRQHYETILKIAQFRNDLIELIADHGQELLGEGQPEALPLLIASGHFFEDHVQEQIHATPIFSQDPEWNRLIHNCLQLHEQGGVIIFPSFDPDTRAVVAVGSAQSESFSFYEHRGIALEERIRAQRTNIGLANTMVRPNKA